MKEFIETIKILGSALIYRISGKRILTKTGREFLTRKRAEWERKAQEIQADLDKEHGRGWGIRVIDGQKKIYDKYTKESLQNA